MAGRSAILSIKILTDATDAQKGFDKAGKAAGGIGSKVKSAAAPAALALAGLGAAAFDAAKAAADDQQAQATLANTLKKTTGASKAQVAATEDFISKTSKATGVADDQLRPAMGNLARATGDTAESQKAMTTALDISAATGADVETVSKALAKAYGGNTGALKKLVPGMDKAVTAGGDMSAIMDEVDKKVGGAADTAANTAAGKYQKMTVAMDEAKESAGTALLPVMSAMADVLVKVADAAAAHPGLFKAIAIVIGVVAGAIIALNIVIGIYETITGIVAIVSGAAWAVALGPILLVILAIAAVIAIVVLLVKNWDKVKAVAVAVWDAIKAAALAVWNWLKGAWAAIQAAAVAAWNGIKAAAVAVWNAIKAAVLAVWNWLKGVFTGFVDANKRAWDRIKTAVANVWTGIKSAIKAVVDWIKSAWQGVVDNLRSAAGTLTDILRKPFDLVRDAIQTVLDLIGDVVSAIKNIKLPSLPSWLGGGGKAAPAGFTVSGEVAPTGLAGRSRAGRATPAATGGVVININGAVDPESTARQVRRILASHDRRMGTRGAGLRAGTV